ncbi:MAG: amidohydrolase family protein [Verrucomicrobia bacterium]|nr:amidohydrolase family protein [Verrucomicrobiota bacterium]
MMNVARKMLWWAGCSAVLVTAIPAVPAEEAAAVPIIDCHVHFWRLDRPAGIGWIAKDNETLYRNYLPGDYESIAKANGVGGVVVVQAGQSLPDNQWNLEITAANKDLFRGVVGNLSEVIGTPEFQPLFEKLCEDERYVGYRLSGRYQDTLTEEFYRNLKLTAGKGRTVDVLVGGYSLTDVAEIAERVPNLKIIIDHFGGVVLDGKPLDSEWVEGFRAVAKRANVYCKVSALYGRVKEQPAPLDIAFYRPVLELAWECFGEDRLVYGSDWPVSRTSGDYGSVLTLTRAYFDGKGRGVSEKLFHGNAARFYGVPAMGAP